jgi:hypothetical protein
MLKLRLEERTRFFFQLGNKEGKGHRSGRNWLVGLNLEGCGKSSARRGQQRAAHEEAYISNKELGLCPMTCRESFKLGSD